MKRSSQVALVLMGLTGTTATAAYMIPSRPGCEAAPAASTTLSPPNAAVPASPAAVEPCRRRSWSGWRWNSYSSHSYYGSGHSGGWFSRGSAPTSVSTAFSSSGRGSSGTSSSSGGTAARGGFGSTGHGMSGGHSGS